MDRLAYLFPYLLVVYFLLGVAFACFFLFRGLKKIDPAASRGSLAFKILILPGIIALWPLLLTKWIRK